VNRSCEALSRRQLTQLLAFGALGAIACDKGQLTSLSCTDTTGITPSDLQIRNSLAYVDHSTEPEKACDKCLHFLPGPENACGTCRIVRGPIHPKGTCKSFVPKIIRR
jgi:hypothetical protein